MNCFLYVLSFYVRDVPNVRHRPHIGWILAFWVAAKFALLCSLIASLPRIRLKYANRVEIKTVPLAFREPENCFMATAKSVFAMQSVSECPNNPIPKVQIWLAGHQVVNQVIQRYGYPVANVVTHLPTNTTASPNDTNQIGQDFFNLRQE